MKKASKKPREFYIAYRNGEPVIGSYESEDKAWRILRDKTWLTNVRLVERGWEIIKVREVLKPRRGKK